MTDNNIEKLLKNVSYKPAKGYVPSSFALEFVNIIKLINQPGTEENKSPLLHYYMLDTLVKPAPRIANMVFRGGAKTSIFVEYLYLYLAVMGGQLPEFGKVSNSIFVGDSMDNGVKKTKENIEYRWRNSPFLQKHVPTVKMIETEWYFKNSDGVELIVQPSGVRTGIRGTKALGTRPQLVVMDDLIGEKESKSALALQEIEHIVTRALQHAINPNRHKIVWNGTPFSTADPLYKAIESGAWESNVFPVCEQFPVPREEFSGAWPDRFTYDYVKEQYDAALKQGAVSGFNQELMLRVISDDDRLVPTENIKWYSIESLMRNKGNFNFLITTDFAVSSKTSADYSCISVWAKNNNDSYFWVDGICAQQDMARNIQDLFTLVQRWNPLEVGIEVSGQQGGFIPWLEKEMMDRNCWFAICNKGKGFNPSTNKFTRFTTVVPMFSAHKIYFPEELKHTKPMLEMIEELRLVSGSGFKSKKDDMLDTISMLSVMQVPAPSSDISAQSNKNGIYDWNTEESTSSLNSYIV